jgi:hypothetical protein
MTEGAPFRTGLNGGETKTCAERLVQQPPAADCLQRPLVPRSRFRQRLRRSVRSHVQGVRLNHTIVVREEKRALA